MSASSILPPEIMEAILCLLPAKSLGRFKSVSKTWNSLISHPQFIKKHLQHLQNTPKLILIFDTNCLLYSLDTNQLLPYLLNINTSHDGDGDSDGDGDDDDNSNNNDDDDDDDDISVTVKEVSFRCDEVYGSCNGLVLAQDENETIFVINPTTQERLEMPFPPLTRPPDGEFYVRYYGFGYDSSTDDYKVVSISVWYLEDRNVIDMCVSVYSLRNNSWKKLQISLPNDIGFCGDLPVIVNQNIHWYTNSSTIVAFSFTTEEFNEFSLLFLDLVKSKMVRISNLVDIDRKLGLFLSVEDVYELWVMEDYGVNNSWTKVCCLDFGLRFGEPVCLVEGSNRDIILDVEGGDVVVFNIDEERNRNVRIGGSTGGFMVLGTYAESLESPTRIVTAS